MPSWPTQSDYKDALQNPDTAFRDPDLRQSRAERSPMGVPRARSGAFASVYKMTGPKGVVALKLFNFPNEDRARRYQAVSDYLELTLGPRKPSCVVKFRYHTNGIRVGKLWYPTLTMSWVRGVSLGEWVRQAVERKAAGIADIRKMADSWVALTEQLQTAKIAHGDLQHDNIMVVGDAPVLVDYDGMCVPALDPLDPAKKLEQLEFGKPAYQHPGRAVERLNGNLDQFSAWVIFIALRAIAADPLLYAKYVLKTDNENLLFTPADMQNPAASELWPSLIACKDPEISGWARVLREALDKPFSKIPPFVLDPFDRLRKLAGASARDWGQIEAETERLKKNGKDVPAELWDRVNPVGSLRELCAARTKDWAKIAVEGERLLATGRLLPSDVKPIYEEARKRVAVRNTVKKALDERNPRAVVTTYQPALIDDWADPKLIAGARSATEQVALLNELKAVVAAPGDGRALVKLWDGHAPKLTAVPEARLYETAATGWRVRITAADNFLRVLAKSPQTEREVAEAWQAVLAAGPLHPVLTEMHRQRGIDAARWAPILERLRRVSNVASHESDTQLLAAWGNGAALAGCAEAHPFAHRVTEARERVALVEALALAIKRTEQGGPEDAVVAAAKKLPTGYSHPYVHRAGEQAEGLWLATEFQRAVEHPRPSDRAIAAAYEKLKEKNPKAAERLNRANPALFAEGERAIERRQLLDRFARIAVDEPRADKQDQKWLALWAESGKTLSDRADREELRARLTLARDRLEKWSKIAEALTARDAVALRKQFTAHGAALAEYPPLMDRMNEIRGQLTRAERIASIRQKIDTTAALAPEDLAFLRDNHSEFDPDTKSAIETQVRTRLAGEARLVPAFPAYSSSGKRGLVKACWSWGGQGLISHCIVAVDGRRFLADPSEADPYSRINCLPENHQREGGGITLVPPNGAPQAYVTIWPVVELGWKTIYGVPLTIGPVPVGNVSPSPSRW
ncbi:hypothetical protein VT84_00580 [Gemmata sp. SH-PL17]|uniref:hypothetical protein n=1 Tax=Gemmata sp. SH-PL17 TaxID=1630693 RepID=UPI0004B687F9|nr:hypothetical protein [Gemmata sp. SH-PL17]AMV22874.1 hypothetical protein VT84_00580 [Gemmata sp. SH-PL17]